MSDEHTRQDSIDEIRRIRKEDEVSSSDLNDGLCAGYMTINQLRVGFENMARSCMFDIERHAGGEYKFSGRNTFTLWAGYWECAKINGIIDPDSDALDMNNW